MIHPASAWQAQAARDASVRGMAGRSSRLRLCTAFFVACLLLVLTTRAAVASEGFLPAGSLSYTETRLDNGLRLVVQPVDSAPYLSLRLVIKTGFDHYPCDDRELPHLVEHLLFSANDQLTETGIDDLVRSWGGSINAYTYPETTEIVLDAHSRFRHEAIGLVATMISGFAPTTDDVAREITVVEQESGVEHTPLRLWWSRQPFTQRASQKFFVDTGAHCNAGITSVRHLAVDDVLRSFDTQYVAANMLLVLVGNLGDDGAATARMVFGALPARPAPSNTPIDIRMPSQDGYASGWLSGSAGLDQPTAMGIAPFHDWRGYYALSLVADWLNDRLYRELRSESGIAYTPVADLGYHGTALSMTLAVETRAADTAFTQQYLRDLVAEVGTQGISEEEFQQLRAAALLGMARAFERISDRADYLAQSSREIEGGGLFDSEAFYSALTYDEFRALVQRDWPARFVVFNDAPPVSWSMRIGLLLGSLALLAAALGWRAWRRLREMRPG